MLITVAICSWNRARLLADALQTIRHASTRTRADLEVVVVDNNSTDHTEQVIQDARNDLPLVPVFESRPGLSHARNAAVRASRGDYIVWTDDDVRVDANWLRAYERAFAAHPEAVFFGGPVEPWFLGTPPRWLSAARREVEKVFAAVDHGPEAFEIRERSRLPFGANFAVRRDEQRAFHYDSRLGRQPGAYWLAGEEYLLLRALLEQGREGWWVPEARVRHLVTRDRQKFRVLLAHGIGNGRTFARINPDMGQGRRRFGRPVWLWKSFGKAAREAVATRLREGPEVWVPKCYEASVLAGRLRESGRS